jgi:hypothetical protein
MQGGVFIGDVGGIDGKNGRLFVGGFMRNPLGIGNGQCNPLQDPQLRSKRQGFQACPVNGDELA